MGIDLTKLTQGANASVQALSKKAGAQNATGAAAKFNTGILDKDTVSFSQSVKKALYPFTDKTTQVENHHDINGFNNHIRDILDNMERGGKAGRYDYLVLERIKDIDAQFAKLPPLEDNFVFYRGRSIHPIIERFNQDFRVIENAKAGDIITPDKGYSYGAFKKDLAEHWAGDMMIEIHTPKGAKVSRNLEHGGEVIFPRGAEYRLISKETSKTIEGKDFIKVILEYILPEK